MQGIFQNVALMAMIIFMASHIQAEKDTIPSIDGQVSAIFTLTLEKHNYLKSTGDETMPGGIELNVYKEGGAIRIMEHIDGGEEYMYIKKVFFKKNGDALLCLMSNVDNGGANEQCKLYFIGGSFVDAEVKAPNKEFGNLSDLASAAKMKGMYKKEFANLKKQGSVTFKKAGKDDRCQIIGMNVNVRNAPDKKSKVVGTLNALDVAFISEVGKKENISGLGEHSWYKISSMSRSSGKDLVGWVFGAFVSPVEIAR